jgi:hypothetical protein
MSSRELCMVFIFVWAVISVVEYVEVALDNQISDRKFHEAIDDCNKNYWNPRYLSYDWKQLSWGRKIPIGFVVVVRSGSVA